MLAFDVTAECADGYWGKAKVKATHRKRGEQHVRKGNLVGLDKGHIRLYRDYVGIVRIRNHKGSSAGFYLAIISVSWGGLFRGCPYKKRPTIWGLYSVPLIF